MAATVLSPKLTRLVEGIKGGRIKKIAFLTGAGMSVAAGLADFRSPGGMYNTLRPQLLTASESERAAMSIDPTTVVSWDLFQNNQLPYHELRRPFILGTAKQQWKATLSHYFVKLCDDRNLLTRLYTQNIDGLDYQCGTDTSKMTSVHGTMGRVECEFCKSEYPIEEYGEKVKESIKDIYNIDSSAPEESVPIPCQVCELYGVKPATVLFGRSLPSDFFTCLDEDFPDRVDLLIIAGTSLQVSPANQLPRMVHPGTYRLVVNRDRVGDELGLRFDDPDSNDIFAGGNCDDVFLSLATELGWEQDLRSHKEKMAPESQKLLV